MKKLGLMTLICLFLLLFVSAPQAKACPPGQFVQDPVTGQLVFVPMRANLSGFNASFSARGSFGVGSPVSYGGAGFQIGAGVAPLGNSSFILNQGAGNLSINANGGFGLGGNPFILNSGAGNLNINENFGFGKRGLRGGRRFQRRFVPGRGIVNVQVG